MTGINRFSSRRERLDHAFLADGLREAKSHIRIAGCFRSSIFELVWEEIADIPDLRIVCNSELDTADAMVSKHAREMAFREKWNESSAEVEALLHRERYRRTKMPARTRTRNGWPGRTAGEVKLEQVWPRPQSNNRLPAGPESTPAQ